ncbi:MAG: hypothetical protein ACE10G_05385 [Gemmatimonadales bacterium]
MVRHDIASSLVDLRPVYVEMTGVGLEPTTYRLKDFKLAMAKYDSVRAA